MTKELDNKNRIDGENILSKIFFISLVVSLIAVELIEYVEREKNKEKEICFHCGSKNINKRFGMKKVCSDCGYIFACKVKK